MLWLDDLSLSRKITTVAIVSAGASLLMAGAAFVAYDRLTFRGAMIRNLSLQAEIVARQSASSLLFEDPEAAARALSALRADPHVVAAAIYTPSGFLFAQYLRDGGGHVPMPLPPAVGGAGHQFTGRSLVLWHPVDFERGALGTVIIESDLDELADRLRRYAMIAALVLVASIVVARLTASRLQGVITRSILELAQAAGAVSANQDFAVRVVPRGKDEVSRLVRTFNEMLDHIQDRDRALQQSEEQYRLLFESNPHPMWVFERGTLRFIAVNEAAVRLYGYSRAEFLGMTIEDIRPPEDVPALREAIASSEAQGTTSDGVWTHRHRDGSNLAVEIASTPIVFHGRHARFVLAKDVSEKQRLETQLLQAQKMEAVGRLAGGVAHDFNNLLGVIMGYSEVLLRGMEPDNAQRARVEAILKASERGAGLTRQLLAFSRKQVLQPRVLELGQAVADMAKMLGRLIGEDVTLETSIEAGAGRVKADPGQMEQVLMNLAVNARDAMLGGGRLTIEVFNAFVDEAYASTHADARAGAHVVLALTDTGMGMSADTISHIFEPFFTTKPLGQGTGLGLATVYGIVRQSEGHICVYSEVGQGTTFKIYLPRVADAASPILGNAHGEPLPGGTETILVVEDEPGLRHVTRQMLEGFGYSVFEAPTAIGALERAHAIPGPIHLVLSDVVLPGQNGRLLWEQLRELRPESRVLFVSGYTDDAIVRHGVLESGTPFLPKPFDARSLSTKVREVLDAPVAWR